MGAEQFYHYVEAPTMGDAYHKSVEQAYYDYGHQGYTGTIAEKNGWFNAGVVSFKLGDIVRAFESYSPHNEGDGWWDDNKPSEELQALVRKYHEIYDDKWGPALAFELKEDPAVPRVRPLAEGEKGFLFLGWASS